MGVVTQEVEFDGQVPGLAQIAAKVADITGLPLSVVESGVDVMGNLYDVHARLAFACAPDDQIELYAYRAGAVRSFCDEVLEDADLRTQMEGCMQGLNEPVGTQVAYLRTYVGVEPTLLTVTALALEALGGRPSFPISDKIRQEYARLITATELQTRSRKTRKRTSYGLLVGALLLPILIPWFFLMLLCSVVTLPWKLWQFRKMRQVHRATQQGKHAGSLEK